MKKLLLSTLLGISFISNTYAEESSIQVVDSVMNNPHVNTFAQAALTSGTVNTAIQLQSFHKVFLSNPYPDHSITYHFTFKLCAQKRGCAIMTFEKSLAPMQIYTEERLIKGSTSYDKPGTYSTWAETIVEGDFPDSNISGSTITVFPRN